MDRDLIITRARTLAKQMKPGAQDNLFEGPEASRLRKVLAGESPARGCDRWVQRFITDTLVTIADKPWDTIQEILEALPPYGFRAPEQTEEWAHWFASLRERTLSVTHFINAYKKIGTMHSVFDLMYDTFRAEQIAVARVVLAFLMDDRAWITRDGLPPAHGG